MVLWNMTFELTRRAEGIDPKHPFTVTEETGAEKPEDGPLSFNLLVRRLGSTKTGPSLLLIGGVQRSAERPMVVGKQRAGAPRRTSAVAPVPAVW